MELAPPLLLARLESLTKRALRAGCEDSALNAQLRLLGEYEKAGDARRYRAARSQVRTLGPRVLPGVWASRVLENGFGISDDDDAEIVGDELARSIKSASKARQARSRVRQLEGLRTEAVEAGRLLEALAADLFLLGDYARLGNLRRIREVRNEIARIEVDSAVQPRLDMKVTEQLDSVYRQARRRKVAH